MREGYKLVYEENENELDAMRVFGVVLIVAGVSLFFVGGQSVFAHGGGLNEQGCHIERATGGCHCHRDEHGRKLSPPVKCEEPPPKDDNLSEVDFVAKFCHARGGRLEQSLSNRMRVDCITEEHAIEGDFAPKWDEAFKQAQHYAIEADRRAGILLILKNEQDEVHIGKLCELIADRQADIDVFAIGHGFAETGDSISCADEI